MEARTGFTKASEAFWGGLPGLVLLTVLDFTNVRQLPASSLRV